MSTKGIQFFYENNSYSYATPIGSTGEKWRGIKIDLTYYWQVTQFHIASESLVVDRLLHPTVALYCCCHLLVYLRTAQDLDLE
jgi:hypothetical protein